MDKKWVLLVFIFALVVIVSNVSADTFEFNGTVYDVNGTALNNTNVSVTLKIGPTDLGTNSTTTNSTGWFNLTVTGGSSDGYQYLLKITHTNDTSGYGYVDFVGQTLPQLPYRDFSQLGNVNFYLKEAGTFNITVVNATANPVANNQFAYQVKDTRLGYPTGSCSNVGTYEVSCYLPRDRNYSIMIYPSDGSPQHFVPVSFEWNNFTATQDYSIGSLSSYNATTKTLHKQFNVTESAARISGYLNGSDLGVNGWDEFTIVPCILEPGNMIFMDRTVPYNTSAWFQQYDTDVYTLTTGFYNISLPYASAETVKYMLFAAARNGSTYYGSYRNITVTGDKPDFNLTMYGLLGDNSTINMSTSTGGSRIVNTTKQTFRLVNASTNQSLANVSAHIEVSVDYSDYDTIEFTFMEDLSETNNGNFSVPLINVTGIKQINVYSISQAPRRVDARTVAQIQANNNISMAAFNPGEIPGETAIAAGDISIAIYKSNETCDVPNPADGCLLTSTADMTTFNPTPVVIGGGKISFRMGVGSVLVNYVDVDMLASGPPDAMFEQSATEGTTDGFSKAMRFGSNGPTIYDYVLISIPYTEGSSSTTGLNEDAEVNISIPNFYDENWDVLWNTASNGTNATSLAGNHSHYSTYQSEWQTLLGNNTCIVTTTGTSTINSSYPCHIDTTNNRIWIRIPHFSGTAPSASGSVITASATTTTTTPSGGGGGGGGVPANKTHKKTQIWTKITPGAATIMKITDPEIGLKQINITVVNPAQTVKITVTKLVGQPASVVHEIVGKVYKYIDIDARNIDETHIDHVRIQFEVNKSWINNNNIDPDTVALNRYRLNAWERLQTRKTGEDNNFVYYEAETPGFSTFAISGEEKVETTTTVPVTTTITTIVTTTIPITGEIGVSAWVAIVLIIVIVGIVGFWLYKKRLVLK